MQRTVSRLVFLVQVSRPIFWPVLPLVYALGLNASRARLDKVVILQMFLLTFPMNLIGCGLNDIYDYESDRRSPRRRTIWGAVVRAEDRPLVFTAVLSAIPFMVVAASLTRNWNNIIATISLVLVAWLYSAPPQRLKERPPLDSLANGLGFFLLPFVMGYSLNAEPREMPLRYYLLALCVCGIHSLATAADFEADRAAGHRTMAVAFGRRTAAGFAFATFLVAWLFGEFHGAVRAYIVVCTAVTLMPLLLPRNSVISFACFIVFVGFGIAAICHLLGL
ncbi:MAG TPA: UbiA family prenyltransferase [Lacipirellulaceae bacterium]|nr:UbiA family prenyltransferase [Lacipirellulaceae bacterium]